MQQKLTLKHSVSLLTAALMTAISISYLKPVNVYAGNDIQDPETGYYWGVSNKGDTGVYIYSLNTNGETVTDLKIPDTIGGDKVLGIGAEAFAGNADLRSVVIPDSVEVIEERAFSGCGDLMKVHLPENLKEMGKEAFMDCGMLGDTYIPYFAEIGEDAIGLYHNGGYLMNAPYFVAHVDYLAESAQDWGPWGLPFAYTVDDFAYVPNNPVSPTSLSLYGFSAQVSEPIYDITIPGEVTLNPSDMEEYQITLPVVSILDSAFLGSTIKSAKIDEGIVSIQDFAFEECEQLSSVEFPSTLENIGDNAFFGCKFLNDIAFPSSLLIIGDRAFAGTALTRAVIPSTHTLLGTNCLGFDSSNVAISGFEIICPYEAYPQGRLYAEFSKLTYHYYADNIIFDINSDKSKITALDIIGNPEKIVLGKNFHYSAEDSDLTADIVSIGANFAEGNTSLKNARLEDSIKEINTGAFDGCTSLNSVCCTSEVYELNSWNSNVSKHKCDASGLCEYCNKVCFTDISLDIPTAEAALDTKADYSLPGAAKVTDSVVWSPAATVADYSTVYSVTDLITIQDISLDPEFIITVNGEACTFNKVSDGVYQVSYTFERTAAKPTPTPPDDPTPTPGGEPTPSSEPTPTTTPTPSVEPTPTPSKEPTPTQEPTPTPSKEPTPTQEPTPTPSKEPTPTLTPTLTPTPTSELDVGAFIKRCYEVALGREADEAGYKYWVDSLNNGLACGSQVGYGFIFSQEYTNKNTSNEEFVNDMYAMYFGREADEAGFNYWLEQLNNQIATRESIMAGFANSQEFFNLCEKYGVVCGTYVTGVPSDMQGGVNCFVARLYKVCLNRLPDMIGQSGWVMKLMNGEVTGSTCSYGFVFSSEFIDLKLDNSDFVKYMYNAFFGREADEVGLNYWVDQLNAGTAGREDVFNGFTGSPEFANLCAGYGINV